jgi:response regulator RpfG family c-di-GMP phosphodiesterase
MDPIKVLIVDDEEFIRDSVKLILDTEGFTTFIADDAYKALKILENNHIDVVISDMKMPGMDGISLLKKIKTDYPNLAVLLITGFPNIDTAIESVKSGAFDYVTKPFKVDDLLTKINKAYESSKLKKEVVELKQLVSIYDSSKFFSSTLNHNEIFNKLYQILSTNFKIEGIYIKLFSKNISFKKNITAEFSKFIDTECTFKKAIVLFEKNNHVITNMSLGNTEYSVCKQPVYIKDSIFGVFFAYKRGSNNFDDTEAKMLAIYLSQLSTALLNSFAYEELSKGYMETIKSLSRAVDAKDHYTMGHSENVKKYSLMIVDEIGFPEDFRDQMTYAGLLHDIGKIGVPTEIIVKPEKLTPSEYEEIKKHPIYGKEILEPIEFLGDVPYYVLFHHEKLDGSGYPFGLTEDEIPVGSKILQIADSFDAMTTDRSYRPRMNYVQALEELERYAGTQFDADILSAFKSALKKEGII